MEASERKLATTLGKYRLIAQIGSGGMGNVYLAVMRGQSDVRRLVVLKVPRDEVSSDPNLLAMFIDEARIAARLSHPNVVQTFEVIREDDRDIIVMEYLDGYTLNEAILRTRKAGTSVPRALYLRIISEALTGLHYAHEATDFDGTPLNLVHRDISPHNVFLTFDAQVKVLDFGIAKATMQSHHTEVGTFKGKVRHMPVEQLAGSDMDRRADVFAVGTMIWEAAVGERLWRKKNDVEVMAAVIAGDIPMPREVNPDAPAELEEICRKALAHPKADRYASCLDLKNDLEAYLTAQPERVTLRDMVSFMESTFADKRAARKKVIDEQLKIVMQGPVGPALQVVLLPASLPSLNPSTTGSGAGTPLTGIGMARSEMPREGARRAAPRRALLLLAIVLLGAVATAAVAIFVPRSSSPVSGTIAPLPAATLPVGPASVAVSHQEPSAAPDPPPPPTRPAVSAITLAPAAPLTPVATTARPSAPQARMPVAVAPTRNAPNAPSAPSATATPSPSADSPGTFSFTTYPWTRVLEGGRLLGTTPLYKIPLSPGTHVLTLENADEGVKTTYTVTIKSGESVNRSMALK